MSRKLGKRIWTQKNNGGANSVARGFGGVGATTKVDNAIVRSFIIEKGDPMPKFNAIETKKHMVRPRISLPSTVQI